MSHELCHHAAQAIGIIGSALASGGIFSISFSAIPTLLLPSRKPDPLPNSCDPGTPASHLSHQWLSIYENGKAFYPFIAGASAAAYAYLAWSLHQSANRQSCNYLKAALATVSIVPYTLVVMGSTNKKLEEHARRDDAVSSEGKEGMVLSEQERAKRERQDREVPALLVKWSNLNAIRSVFPLIGAVVGFCAGRLSA